MRQLRYLKRSRLVTAPRTKFLVVSAAALTVVLILVIFRPGSARKDSEALDASLDPTNLIDTIMFVRLQSTNVLHGQELAAFLRSLTTTNREQVRFGAGKGQVTASIILQSGPKELLVIEEFGDDGLMQYNDYCFKVKSHFEGR